MQGLRDYIPFPVPFSPVMRTFASEGATRETSSITGRICGESEIMFGILPREQFVFCLEPAWLLRIALPSAICVRTIVSRRSLSHGLGNKIARTEFHRFDRRDRSVAHAVMTTIGSVSSSA